MKEYPHDPTQSDSTWDLESCCELKEKSLTMYKLAHNTFGSGVHTEYSNQYPYNFTAVK